MYTLINPRNPLQNAIIFYIIIIALILMFKPDLTEDHNNKYRLPLIIIMVSIMTYYIFALLSEFLV